jgi:hypothetical protein
LLRHIVWQKFTDVSEVLAASIVRAMIALMVEAAIFIFIMSLFGCFLYIKRKTAQCLRISNKDVAAT